MSANASTSRPLPLFWRADLEATPQSHQGRRCWVVKDPLSLKYFRFEEEEYALITMLDGRTSLDQLRATFSERFAPRRISLTELQRLLGLLHDNGLIISNAAGQGTRLSTRGQTNAHRRQRAALTNPLSIRFRGFDPSRLLAWLDRRIGWLFSKPAVACGMIFIAAALLLVAVQFDSFRLRLPGFREFFAAENWFWLAATLAATKILHELGHGLACRRQGGECHEMGVLLLVFTPCLYCNVSDSWTLPSKWRRAAIAAAGMYVELLLAAAAAFLWWFSQPGLLHYLCLNVMFVCSVSTLIFNANPLMRYDGYYILSDLAEIPNLRARADELLAQRLAWLFFGRRGASRSFSPPRGRPWLTLYAVAACLYRVTVAVGVLWFLNGVLEPQGLKVLGQALAVVTLIAMATPAAKRFVRFLRRLPMMAPWRFQRPTLRPIIAGAGVVTVAAVVLFLPFPHYVVGVVELRSRGAHSVYVESPGRIQEARVHPGQRVARGQKLATLVNYDLDLEIERLEGEREQLRARLAALERQALRDEAAARRLAQTSESLASIDDQLQKRLGDQSRLSLFAPVDGEVIWPTIEPTPNQESAGSLTLASWSGAPLDRANVGAWLDAGSLACQIGDSTRLLATVRIDQSDIEFVAPGQPVIFQFTAMPGARLSSRIDRVAMVEPRSEKSPPSRASGVTTFEASAPLDDPSRRLFIGSTGRGRIRVGSRPLAARLWRAVCAIFQFEL